MQVAELKTICGKLADLWIAFKLAGAPAAAGTTMEFIHKYLAMYNEAKEQEFRGVSEK